jgi:hypothetical protein
VLVLLVLIEVRFLSPPYSNCPGSTCLTHLGTEGVASGVRTASMQPKGFMGTREIRRAQA